MTRRKSPRRCIGLDVHRDFAQVAIWEDGVVSQAGRFDTTPEQVWVFADSLTPSDEVALEATGNTWAIATVLGSRAGRVVVSKRGDAGREQHRRGVAAILRLDHSDPQRR